MSSHKVRADKIARYLERRLSKHDISTWPSDGAAGDLLRENEYSQLETDWETALLLAAVPVRPGLSADDTRALDLLAARYGIG